ncbi:MAG: hypothetical protein Q9215_006699 [Flavoplaca cf. flavocitrina]
MAADTRDSTSPKQPTANSNMAGVNGKTYDTFNYPATIENKDSLPGANSKTLVERQKEPGFVEALKTIKLQDFKEVHKKPCTREGFLTGIGAAFATGGVRAILGAKRRREKEGIQKVNAALMEKKIKEEMKREGIRKARRKAKEEAER